MPAFLNVHPLIGRDVADAPLGSDVRVAHSAGLGLQVVGEFHPDVVLLDIGMPGMDGYEACRQIRRGPRGQEPFIVAVTGLGQEQDKRRAFEAGFDAHLTKPADPILLERLLANPHRSGVA
jgi:CheY-like chemotaxis protein